MKSIAVFPSTRELRIIEEPEPRIASPSQVLLRILDVGICGTDREICSFEYGLPPAGSSHLVIGHESVAEVVEVGAAVTSLRRGDLVIPMVRRPCAHAHCTACRAGRQDFCYTGDFCERGIKGAHGFMTELVVEEERYLNPVPRSLRDIAVLVEPLTIAQKALIQLWDIQERLPWGCPHRPGRSHGHCRRAVVLGAGPVGLLGAMALCAAGFETIVYSRDRTPHPKAELTQAIGATYVSSEDVTAAELAEQVGTIDVVYEAAGASRVAFDVMQALGPNSVFIFTGVPGRREPVEVDTDRLMRNLVLRNQVVFGTVNAGRDAFEAAIRELAGFAQRWPGVVSSLISGRHSIESHRELLLGRPGGIKHVLQMAA
ncbi:MAG TPA: glucose 1-dehydrogenase [Candidatus Limnocylindrales bacterium]|nr:glucose 1-dehydrogenase [Candidatus Limnocylindrales bacterium]